ncbi:GNAT family N-acetyltransferase [Cognatishimia sp.]|uniref:GNAT family N-acetyltransferase n=1 Tax=Cognatishimia sp. TaxID=2211648 RepID=UPI003516FAD2|nr:GNAT family N-acetyltransferase [Cognatishimia sp.]NQY59118.1 GNAT family N-acetyltransferase [Cognatishimia sp.]
MKTRPLTENDWPAAAALYAQLNTKVPLNADAKAIAQFAKVLAHDGTTIFGALSGDQVKAMVTLHLMPNVTYGGRPYGLIENVVTDQEARGQGLAKAAMTAALEAAWLADAYKVMLLTGLGNEAVGFYEKLGFVSTEKAGMILRRP